ncbi:MAG: hypothetical protein ABSH52_27070 [Terriglobia bacterium]|jgi:hypothetical protein
MPTSYDADIADPDVHQVVFEDEHIMFFAERNAYETLTVHDSDTYYWGRFRSAT